MPQMKLKELTGNTDHYGGVTKPINKIYKMFLRILMSTSVDTTWFWNVLSFKVNITTHIFNKTNYISKLTWDSDILKSVNCKRVTQLLYIT